MLKNSGKVWEGHAETKQAAWPQKDGGQNRQRRADREGLSP